MPFAPADGGRVHAEHREDSRRHAKARGVLGGRLTDLRTRFGMKPKSMIIELPQVGESVTEGVIGKWLKSVGDRVERFDPLVEVVTDKVNMEMPSPVTGTLTAVLSR